MSKHYDPRAGELRLTLGVRASIASYFDFEPYEEIVLDAEWDTMTISQETASPGVYFVSAIISISREGSGGPDFLLELEPIMITVTASGGDSARSAEAP